MIDRAKQIEALILKAVNAVKSEDSLRFSQAACNVATAMRGIKNPEAM
jgi:hypothetical protein